MKSVIVAWHLNPRKNFERLVPLQFLGERNRALGFQNSIDVVFLEGLQHLPSEYRGKLSELGFTLYDASSLYREQAERYAKLSRFGDYEFKCMLRWPVLQHLFSGTSLIHYDGDILFNECPSKIAELAAGQTFVLQGCPAMAAISTPSWYMQYQIHLDRLASDVEGYSQEAWKQRVGWEKSQFEHWAGARDREIITSDQDLISHLLHTRNLPQDSVSKIQERFDRYILMENPLYPHLYAGGVPFRYVRDSGIDYFDTLQGVVGESVRKQVLFWHMQGCFNFYASKNILRQHLPEYFRKDRMELDLSGKRLEDRINRKLGRFFRHTDRYAVYDFYFRKYDFGTLFSDKTWWKPGVFTE